MNEETKAELRFVGKVIRNAIILAGLFFVSVFAVGDLTWTLVKPIIVFLFSYILTELAKHYNIDMKYKTLKDDERFKTFIFY